MGELHWVRTAHFLPESGTYWVKLDDMPAKAELKRGVWSDRWFKEGIRIYPKEWANI